MDIIAHLGYQTAFALMDRGWVKDPADLYVVTDDQLGNLPGFKEKSVDNLRKAIEGSKDRPLWKLLVALSIRHVGPAAAKKLMRAFPSIEKLEAASLEELEQVEQVGAEIAESVHEWLHEEETQALLKKLRAAGVRMADAAAPAVPDGPLTGKTLVLTGTFPTLSREQAIHLAESAGAKVTQTVSKKTSFVVAGTEPGTKLARAIELGVEVIDETELQRRASGE